MVEGELIRPLFTFSIGSRLKITVRTGYPLVG